MNYIIELQSKEHKTNNLDAFTKKKHVSHLTSAAQLVCSSTILGSALPCFFHAPCMKGTQDTMTEICLIQTYVTSGKSQIMERLSMNGANKFTPPISGSSKDIYCF
jgi:hypothetical protein